MRVTPSPSIVTISGPRATTPSRRKLRWREGSKATLEGRFSFCRVKTTHEDGLSIEDREPVWLVIEWPLNDEQAIAVARMILELDTHYRGISA